MVAAAASSSLDGEVSGPAEAAISEAVRAKGTGVFREELEFPFAFFIGVTTGPVAEVVAAADDEDEEEEEEPPRCRCDRDDDLLLIVSISLAILRTASGVGAESSAGGLTTASNPVMSNFFRSSLA